MKVYRFKEDYHVNRWRLALAFLPFFYMIMFYSGIGVIGVALLFIFLRRFLDANFSKNFKFFRSKRGTRKRALYVTLFIGRNFLECSLWGAAMFAMPFIFSFFSVLEYFLPLDGGIFTFFIRQIGEDYSYSDLTTSIKLELQLYLFAFFFSFLGLVKLTSLYIFLSLFWNLKFLNFELDASFQSISVVLYVLIIFSLFNLFLVDMCLADINIIKFLTMIFMSLINSYFIIFAAKYKLTPWGL